MTVNTVKDLEQYDLLLRICDFAEGTQNSLDDILDEFDCWKEFKDYDDFELIQLIACAGRIILTERDGWLPFSAFSKNSRKTLEDFVAGKLVDWKELSDLQVDE
jgi:hypothetical protein